MVLLVGFGNGAIGRHEDLVVSHVSVVSGEQDADIRGDAGQVSVSTPKSISSVYKDVEKKPECMGLRTK